MKKRGVVYIFSRYLFTEGLAPLLFSLLGLTVFFVSGMLYEMTDMLVTGRISIFVVAQILFCRLPWVWVMVLPISALFATVFSLGRLMKDNEIDCMRMSGLSLYRIYVPFILLGLLVSFTAYWMEEQVVPWANSRTTELFSQVVKMGRDVQMKENVFFRESDGRLFYVRQADRANQIVYDIMIYETLSDDRSRTRIITAPKGIYTDNEWELETGVVHERDENGFVISQTRFDAYLISVENGSRHFFSEGKSPEEMTRAELAQEIQLFTKMGLKTSDLEVSYYLKLAKAFASLILVLVGVPLSLRNRRGKIVGILITLVVAFGYYIVVSLGQSLGTSGFLPPMLAAWMPNLLFGAVGLFLLLMEEFFVVN